jgi:hypothetical protein
LTSLKKSAMTPREFNKMRPAKTNLWAKKPNRSASIHQNEADRSMAQIRGKILRKLLVRIEKERLFYALPRVSSEAANPPTR